jgi:ABC-type antimicrobial peptide transport system permease subunit
MKKNFKKLISSYNFTDDIPKEYLFVRLKKDLPQYRREYISNGLRAFLRDDLSFVFDINDMRATLESSISLFDLFSVIVGIIALILAFFLLLTSTNANIRDNFWELGVLKAIGLDKAQCFRMLLYEAFSTVVSALVLGIGIGLLIAFTLTAQFYLFIELPIRLSVKLNVILFTM